MTTHRLQQVHELFDEALRRPVGERAAFLDRACGEDAELRQEVEALLKHDQRAEPAFLRPPEPADDVRLADAELVRQRAERLIGRQVGGYRVERVIAVGGMGAVYEAVQKHPERIVALKVLHRNVASHSALRRFQFESQVLGRLRHPNVAQIYEAGMYDDAEGLLGPAGGAVPYFAMELIDGARPITQYADDQRLDARRRLTLFAKVCDAVHSGHQKGVIHRDLKPANILVDATGDPKVIDFGVARGTDSDLAITTQQTLAGQLVGTMQYMSPEQCDADPHDLDTRSDVYSLGVVLYELLTGELPYDASNSTIVKSTQLIKEQTPPKPSTINRKLRGDIETIVLKALEKDRDKRYVSAADLEQDVRRYLNREPIKARPPTTWTRCAHWLRRHPAIVTLIACAFLGAVGGLSMALTSNYYVRRFHLDRPSSIVVNEDGRVARLMSMGGVILHTWKTESSAGIAFAELVERPSEFGGGQLALVGFNKAYDYSYANSLCAFDASGDLTTPVWQGLIKCGDAVPDPHGHGFVGEDFNVAMAKVVDLFPDRPGDEIVVVHQVKMYSQCFIRIYDLTGRALYQVWHDGTLSSCFWMPEARLLVFTGLNSEEPGSRRGLVMAQNIHPLVVFAIRPRIDFIGENFLRSTSGDDPFSPAWYSYLSPANASDLIDELTLTTPEKGGPGRSVHFSVLFDLKLGASVGWDIDEFGNTVSDSRVPTDNYNRNQLLPDGDPKKLPAPDVFKLGPLPPISRAPVGENTHTQISTTRPSSDEAVKP